MRPLATTAVAAVAALASALPAVAAPATPTRPGAPTAGITWTGRLVAPATARTAPDPGAGAVTVVQPVAPLGGGATILQITAVTGGADGRRWARVRLPVRPNGAQGWLPVDVMRLNTNRLRIRVDLSRRTLELFRAGVRVSRITVAVGTRQNPTPTGRFAVAEIIRTHDRGGFLGPVVFPLTAFSETLNEYAGGNGRVALHGTSLPALLGTRASHGCVRIHNRDVVRLARVVRPGTPVDIVP
jgi:lipoprotein-anchoring transpeptidase ErfK/SrfK